MIQTYNKPIHKSKFSPKLSPNLRPGLSPNLRPGLSPNLRPGLSPNLRPGLSTKGPRGNLGPPWEFRGYSGKGAPWEFRTPVGILIYSI